MERDVLKIDENQRAMRAELETVTKDLNEVTSLATMLKEATIDIVSWQSSADLEKTRTELRSTQRQCELVKNLLADATAENEIMYEV